MYICTIDVIYPDLLYIHLLTILSCPVCWKVQDIHTQRIRQNLYSKVTNYIFSFKVEEVEGEEPVDYEADQEVIEEPADDSEPSEEEEEN